MTAVAGVTVVYPDAGSGVPGCSSREVPGWVYSLPEQSLRSYSLSEQSLSLSEQSFEVPERTLRFVMSLLGGPGRTLRLVILLLGGPGRTLRLVMSLWVRQDPSCPSVARLSSDLSIR